MDTSMMTPVVSWIRSEFSGRDRISREELVARANGSELPQDAKDALGQLPPGEWAKEQLISKVQGMYTGDGQVDSVVGIMTGMGSPTGRRGTR